MSQTWQAVPPDARRYRGFSPWDLIIIVDLIFIGANFLLVLLQGPAGETAPFEDRPDVALLLHWLSVILGLVLFAGLPLLWIAMTREERWEGTLHWLGVRGNRRNNWFWLGMASLVAVALFAAVILLGLLLDAAGVDPGGDPLFEQMVRLGGWPLIIAVSIGAGVGEEVLFRGVLQRWLGMWGQAALFGLVHVNQGWIAVLFIFGIALVFGALKRRGMPLWALMVAHASYDVILLGQLKLAGG